LLRGLEPPHVAAKPPPRPSFQIVSSSLEQSIDVCNERCHTGQGMSFIIELLFIAKS
jgi:hypothetical protein